MNDTIVLAIIERAKDGASVEDRNIDLKQEWWDFSTKPEEFLKDICAMANTASGDSYIIIGVDKHGKIHNAPLPMDEANLQAKHKDRIDPRLKVEFNEITIGDDKISVVYISHSANRPHIVKKYRGDINLIPIRVGSSTLSAGRLDIDEMYEERNTNTKPKIEISLPEQLIQWQHYIGYGRFKGGWSFSIRMSIDNLGSIPDYITNVQLIETSNNYWQSTHFSFDDATLDEGLEIEAYKRKSNVLVYVSDQEPLAVSSREMNTRPDIDKDKLVLKILTRSGATFELPIKSGWIGS